MEVISGLDVPVYWLLIPLAFLLFYLYGTWPYSQFKQMGIPGPKPLPFVGNFYQIFAKSPYYTFGEWTNKYGRVYGLYLQRLPAIVITDVDIVKAVMIKEFNNFTDRVKFNVIRSKLFEKMVFFAEGADWKRIRTVMTPTFSAGKLRLMEPFINSCSKVLTDNLVEQTQAEKKVDVKEYFGAFTMDVIAGTAFGIQMNSQKDLNHPFLTSIKEIFNAPQSLPRRVLLPIYSVFPFLTPIFSMVMNSRWFANKYVKYYADNITSMMEQRRQKLDSSNPVDYLQLLMNAETTKESTQSDKLLTSSEIKSQMLIFFLAGYETTATTLQYLAYNLAKYPQVQQRLVDEIREKLGQAVPTCENVAKLKYMEQVIQETLRMFPPVLFVNRMALKTTTIKGLTIPEGFGVMIPMVDVMRDPENFPDPEVFNPDRFSDKSAIDPTTYLPFGLGPRQCLGMRLALLELKVALVHVLSRIQFVDTPDLPDKIDFKGTTALLPPVSPILIKTKLRQADQ